MTEVVAQTPLGWIMYDGECGFCLGFMRWLQPPLHRRGFRLIPLQSAWARERLQITMDEPLTEMKLLMADGHVSGGADAVMHLARLLWWARPLVLLTSLPGGMSLLRGVYRRVAANRQCGSRCSLTKEGSLKFGVSLSDWLPLILLPAVAVMVRNRLPAWVFMWAMAFAIFFGCKWLTWRRACTRGCHPSVALSLGYLFAWPGMDAMAFCATTKRLVQPKNAHLEMSGQKLESQRDSGTKPRVASLRATLGYGDSGTDNPNGVEAASRERCQPKGRQNPVGVDDSSALTQGSSQARNPEMEQHKVPTPQGLLEDTIPSGLEIGWRLGVWIFAAAKTLVGALIIWAAIGETSASPLLAGWLALIGLVLFLHFGLFHLLALAWQAAGGNAQPIMRAPLLATSLAQFWGWRWNTAFHTLAHDLVFRPLVSRYGTMIAGIGVFLISGLIHETVISLPARGGYGLPTGYFALQSLGVLAERSRWGRRFGLGRGFRGWLFVVLCAGAPAFWLFHPVFIRNVILPMLHAIGPN